MGRPPAPSAHVSTRPRPPASSSRRAWAHAHSAPSYLPLLPKVSAQEYRQPPPVLKPLTDVFLAEFYKTFQGVLAPKLFWTVQDGARGREPTPCSPGSLLKPGKDSLDVTSYRPTAVLNIDDKIHSMIRAQCVKPVVAGVGFELHALRDPGTKWLAQLISLGGSVSRVTLPK
ncbi:hypothetical protein NDU88_001261 [Pleurodeles waltl]|uniref:Uncharacterized protein n=1 Tax=Pleurodeles waltl TaxID=8319 RepID=A0AAV7M010_PLEWA|nr:hypothetical protein NDU88_001261 [Pleurodeles waltl]